MTEHEFLPAIMEPGPHIKHVEEDGEERWATVQGDLDGELYCPYCGVEVDYEE